MANLIDLIKELRDRTGAGLMDCKAALLASDQDIDKAADYLREKGIAKAAKKASRIAAEGLVVAKTCKCGCRTVIVEVNCETDFVAKGDDFKALVDGVATTILEQKLTTVEEAKEATATLFTDATVKMGEKFDLRRFEVIEKEDGQSVNTYVHFDGKKGVVALFDKDVDELGKGIAMHIAANAPKYGSTDEISADEIAHEKSIQMELAKNDEKLVGKPEAMIEKIVDAKVNKHFAEMVLTAQAYLLDDSKTVGKALEEKGAKLLKFVRYQVGEGIEKRQDDFASEVMSQVK